MQDADECMLNVHYYYLYFPPRIHVILTELIDTRHFSKSFSSCSVPPVCNPSSALPEDGDASISIETPAAPSASIPWSSTSIASLLSTSASWWAPSKLLSPMLFWVSATISLVLQPVLASLGDGWWAVFSCVVWSGVKESLKGGGGFDAEGQCLGVVVPVSSLARVLSWTQMLKTIHRVQKWLWKCDRQCKHLKK